MSFGVMLHTALAADDDVKAFVGEDPVRVYPGSLPQDCEYPAIAYTVVDDRCLNSVAGFTSRTRNARVQVDVYARSYMGAHALADAVEAVLGALRSPSLSSTQGSRRDLREDAVELHRVSTDFSIWSTT